MSRTVKIGNVTIGKGFPVAIQSMTNTDTKNVEKTLAQINSLSDAGCDIVRLSIYDEECVESLRLIRKKARVPLVADIHFDYKLAIGAVKSGVDKIRINPGNIGAKWKVEEVARAAKDHNVPIRVGANMGSIKTEYLSRYSRIDALVESAMDEVRQLEKVGFEDIVVAVKSSDAIETLRANEKLSRLIEYPIHIGVTEAGAYEEAIVKSAFALGMLLHEGIGDTIRVSIAGDPVREVRVAKRILKVVHKTNGIEVIACPTCARTEIDVEKLAMEVEEALSGINGNLKVAVMGCVVNGLGEARDADIAVFGTKNGGVVYRYGEKIGFFEKRNIPGVLKELVEEEVKKHENHQDS